MCRRADCELDRLATHEAGASSKADHPRQRSAAEAHVFGAMIVPIALERVECEAHAGSKM